MIMIIMMMMSKACHILLVINRSDVKCAQHIGRETYREESAWKLETLKWILYEENERVLESINLLEPEFYI